MDKVTFQISGGEDKTIFAASGENLLELARKANVAIDAPCSGNGSCGKCHVRIVSGKLKTEKSRHIDSSDYEEGWRLACISQVDGDLIVEVPDIASAYKSRMKVADLSSPEEVAVFTRLKSTMSDSGIVFESGVKAIVISMDEPTLDDTMPDNERFVRAVAGKFGTDDVVLPYHVMHRLPGLLRGNDFALRCIVDADSSRVRILDARDKDDAVPVCGAAIDIGTTTVSAIIVDLQSGEILAKASSGNGQIRYGADVINRIIEQQKAGGTKKLQDAVIIETIIPVIESMCNEIGITRDRIYRLSIASNTTMNHLLLGIDANPLRMEPYIPAFFDIRDVPATALGLGVCPSASVMIAPNIGSYVGGDITAGALAGMIWNAEELSMLIDLGTNGEIVFGNSEFLMACACSAGPAFEGGDISCGMRATDGAIEACVIDRDTLEPQYTVIGDSKPVGLCGSGLIDVISELFRADMINGKGKFIKESRRIVVDEFDIGSFVLAFADESQNGRTISLSEIDIDNFIRAKGAIFSAIFTLLSSLGFTPEDISKVYVAGGIGSGINIKNAIRIGMLPDLPLEKYEYIGNSSLAGAYASITSKDAREKLYEISRSMTYVELSIEPGYMDSFIAACFLPHTDATLFPSAEVD